MSTPVFKNMDMKVPLYMFDRYVWRDILISSIKESLKQLSEIKKSVRSLKNLCIFSIMKNGIKVHKDEIPSELFDDIRIFCNKHRIHFVTDDSYLLRDDWIIKTYVPIPCSYGRYAMYGTNDKVYFLPNEIDKIMKISQIISQKDHILIDLPI